MPLPTPIEGSSLWMSSGKWNKTSLKSIPGIFIPKTRGYSEGPGTINYTSTATFPRPVLLELPSLYRVYFVWDSHQLKSQISQKKSILGSFPYQCQQNRLQHHQSRGRLPRAAQCTSENIEWGTTRKKCPVSKFTELGRINAPNYREEFK